MSDTIRLFIAVEIDEVLRENIRRLTEKLKQSGADVKWVAPDNIHITLRFIGWVDEGQVPAIMEVIHQAVRPYQPFKITLKGLGGFPNINSPRVIWVGVDEPSGILAKIYRAIEEGLCALGLAKDDHPFSSHLTIGRTRSSFKRGILANLLNEGQGFTGGEQTVRKITLFRSQLHPTGPVYTVLATAGLTR